MLTDREVLRCEARLGSVALFMPTQPDGDYKLDLREFADRQIATLLFGEPRTGERAYKRPHEMSIHAARETVPGRCRSLCRS